MWKRNREAGDRLRAGSRQRIRESEGELRVWTETEKSRVEGEHRERLDRMENKIRIWEDQKSHQAGIQDHGEARAESRGRKGVVRWKEGRARERTLEQEKRKQELQGLGDRNQATASDGDRVPREIEESQSTRHRLHRDSLEAEALRRLVNLERQQKPILRTEEPRMRRDFPGASVESRGITNSESSRKLLPTNLRGPIRSPDEDWEPATNGSTVPIISAPDSPKVQPFNADKTVVGAMGIGLAFEEDHTLEQLMKANNLPRETPGDPIFERDDTLEQLIKAEEAGNLKDATMNASEAPQSSKVEKAAHNADNKPSESVRLSSSGNTHKSSTDRKQPVSEKHGADSNHCKSCGCGIKKPKEWVDESRTTAAVSSYLSSLFKALSPTSKQTSWSVSTPNRAFSTTDGLQVLPNPPNLNTVAPTDPIAQAPIIIYQYRWLPPRSHWIWKVLLPLLAIFVGSVIYDWWGIGDEGCVIRYPGNRSRFGYHPAWYDPICLLLFCGQAYVFQGDWGSWNQMGGAGYGYGNGIFPRQQRVGL